MSPFPSKSVKFQGEFFPAGKKTLLATLMSRTSLSYFYYLFLFPN